MTIDLASDFGNRLSRHLREVQVVWLTTIKPDGTPEPNPVWFYWDGDEIHIRAQKSAKLRNIKADARVVLHFDTTADGSTVEVIHGTARLSDDEAFSAVKDQYLAKYSRRLQDVNLTGEEMLAAYPHTISIKPVRIRGW